VVVGGHTAAAYRRAIRHADGWYGFLRDRTQAAADVEALRAAAEAEGRDLAGFSVTISPSERLDPDVVRGYAELGVDRLVVVPPPKYWRDDMDLGDVESYVRRNAPERVVQAG
jgi:alkanesulfonate monooxygenase SsuD/methylene tetrahydromethanopterin reductase-like flavin-dependent oxidoreductase (luciferase family)